jgi:hypothetical protein
MLSALQHRPREPGPKLLCEGQLNPKHACGLEVTRHLQIAGVQRLESDFGGEPGCLCLGVGVVTRKVYDEVPPRVEYSLTKYGRSLRAVMSELCKWGEQHRESAIPR